MQIIPQVLRKAAANLGCTYQKQTRLTFTFEIESQNNLWPFRSSHGKQLADVLSFFLSGSVLVLYM